MTHVSLLPNDPNPDGSCRACRGPVNPITLLCERCGAAYGEKNRCPHCRTICRTQPHAELHHKCSVCGKPRLPPGPSTSPISPVVSNALARAYGEHNHALFLRFLAYFLTALSGFSGLFVVLFLWVANLSTTGNVTFSILPVVPLLFAIFAHFSSKKALLGRAQALDMAYAEQVVSLLTQIGTSADGARIAGMLGLSLDRTEAILSKLNADDRMTSDVTDDGEVVYSVGHQDRYRIEAVPQLRVGTENAPATSEDTANAIIEGEFDEEPNTKSKQTRLL